jgi:3-deoxy-7-phosphoheptulonate synthase
MIIRVKQDSEVNKIISTLKDKNFDSTEVVTQSNRYIVAIGKTQIDIREIGILPGVIDVFNVSDSFQLVSRKWRKEPTQIDLGDSVIISEDQPVIMMGPCSIENEAQVKEISSFLKEMNVPIMRGGAFKPRSSPYSFQGLGIEGLKMFNQIALQKGLKVISEVLEPSQIEDMLPYVDIFQVGARNSQNFSLLNELGRVDKPVLLKRGLSGSLEELLNSAEYIFSKGNEKILLCERGIRTYETAYRNTFDINAIPILKEKSHLPVIADPSHGIGIRRHVENVTLGALMAGCDGIIIETHRQPEKAMSDGQQTLSFAEAKQLVVKVKEVIELRKKLDEIVM